MRRLALPRAAAVLLAMQTGLAAADGASGADPAASELRTVPDRTVKERLSGKATDEQRVDNCKVPFDLRGPKPRPDDCSHGASSGAKR